MKLFEIKTVSDPFPLLIGQFNNHKLKVRREKYTLSSTRTHLAPEHPVNQLTLELKCLIYNGMSCSYLLLLFI